jgi:hypothetical protein
MTNSSHSGSRKAVPKKERKDKKTPDPNSLNKKCFNRQTREKRKRKI